MWSDAFAQGGAGKPVDPTMAFLFQLLQFVPIFLILYLLLIRPQQQKQKKLDQMVKALKKGDRVLTSGGMFGTVVGVDEGKVVLRVSDEVKLEFAKSAIVHLVVEDAKK